MWWQQRITKKGEGHIYHCVASPLILTAVYKHLGTVETGCWTFGRAILSHSFLIEAYSCSTILGLLCHFVIHKLFSNGERLGLQAAQFSFCTLQICKAFHERSHVDESIFCSKISIYFSTLMVPFQMSHKTHIP